MRGWSTCLPALTLGALVAAGSVPANAQSSNPSPGVTVKAHTSNDQILNLRRVAFEGGKTLNLIGRHRQRGVPRRTIPPNVIWTVSDRGPNFTCGDAKDIIGIRRHVLRRRQERPVYPVPELHSVDLPRRCCSTTAPSASPTSSRSRTATADPLSGMLNPLKRRVHRDAAGRHRRSPASGPPRRRCRRHRPAVRRHLLDRRRERAVDGPLLRPTDAS